MIRSVAAIALSCIAVAALAQEGAPPIGQPPATSIGTVGQRQTRTDAQDAGRIEPMVRIDSRISNRIQSRLRTRIDRNYVAPVDATDAFDQAEERIRQGNSPKP